MKNIINFINESNKGWNFYKSVYDPSGTGLKLDGFDNTDVKWIYININDYSICPYTENDVKQATKDLEDDNLEKELRKLKIGDSYNDEGNIYLRIK